MHAVQQDSIATTTPHRPRPVGPLDQGTSVSWWGWSWQPAVRALRAMRDGYALASTLHADSASEAIAHRRDRRLVSLDRLRPAPEGPTAEPLVRDDPVGGWIHDHTGEARLVGERHGWSAESAERAIARRTDRITDLIDRGVFATDDVKAALAPLNDLNEGGPE
jgi:hypothetical protein